MRRMRESAIDRRRRKKRRKRRRRSIRLLSIKRATTIRNLDTTTILIGAWSSLLQATTFNPPKTRTPSLWCPEKATAITLCLALWHRRKGRVIPCHLVGSFSGAPATKKCGLGVRCRG
jgi:hypothetical protein